MADTFISYAREDTEFVRRLVAALTAAKREPWVDWEGIVPADQWMDSVRDAIDASDAFVFVISADSVASATCGLELAHAAEQHKRLVPVVWREPDGAVPAALAALNWVFLRESDPQLAVLLAKEALRADPTEDVKLAVVATLDRSFLTRILHGPGRDVLDVAYSPDGTQLAMADVDGVTTLWRTSEWTRTGDLTTDHRGVVRVRYSNDGRLLATANLAGAARIWDLKTAKVVTELTGHTASLTGIAFSPDGTQLASVGGDATVRMWDVATGRAGRVFDNPIGVVFAVAFSPDGRLVAAAGQDPSIRLWDAHVDADIEGIHNPRVEPVHVLRGHRQLVQGLAFSPDGKSLVSASGDKTARVWRVSSASGAATTVVADDRAPSTYPIPSVSVGGIARFDLNRDRLRAGGRARDRCRFARGPVRHRRRRQLCAGGVQPRWFDARGRRRQRYEAPCGRRRASDLDPCAS